MPDVDGGKQAGTFTCPECGRRFARNNQQHVCDTSTVEDHLAGKPAHVVELFRRFSALVEACGPFEYAPSRQQVGFRVNRIFAGVQIRQDGLRGYLDLMKQVHDSRFQRVSPYTKRLFVHHFAISSPDQLDTEFAQWIRDAYMVGQGKASREGRG